MQAHEIEVVIPEDHRLTVQVPESIRSGPARMILLIPAEDVHSDHQVPDPKALDRWRAMVEELGAESRPFDELSLEDRRARLRRIMGAGRGISSSSEEFARQKRLEVELEEQKFAR